MAIFKRAITSAILLALGLAGALATVREQATYREWLEGISTPEEMAATDVRPWSRWPGRVQERAASISRAMIDFRGGLVAAGVGLAGLSFRRHEVTRRRRPGPGHVASLIVASLAAITTVAAVRGLWIDPLIPWPPQVMFPQIERPWQIWQAFGGELTTWSIIVTWLAMAATGRWTRPRAPHDRAGRWLGRAWIASAVVGYCTHLISIS